MNKILISEDQVRQLLEQNHNLINESPNNRRVKLKSTDGKTYYCDMKNKVLIDSNKNTLLYLSDIYINDPKKSIIINGKFVMFDEDLDSIYALNRDHYVKSYKLLQIILEDQEETLIEYIETNVQDKEEADRLIKKWPRHFCVDDYLFRHNNDQFQFKLKVVFTDEDYNEQSFTMDLSLTEDEFSDTLKYA